MTLTIVSSSFFNLVLHFKLTMVWAAPNLNGLVSLFGLIWFSVNGDEIPIGLVRFAFLPQWVGLVRIEILFRVHLLASDRSGQLVQLDRTAVRTDEWEHQLHVCTMHKHS